MDQDPTRQVAPGGWSGPARDGKGKAARTRILDAAEAAFAEYGFAGATLRVIGSRIGTGNASMLHHFPDKRRLYAAVLHRIAMELEQALLPSGHEQDLRCIAEAWLDWNLSRPQAATLMLRELLDNAQRAERAKSWPMQRLMQRVGLAARAVVRGPAAKQDPMILAFQVIGAIAYVCAGQRTIAAIMETDPVEVIAGLRNALQVQIDALTGTTPPALPG